MVEDRKVAFQLTDEDRVGFPLDLRRAAAMKNMLRVHFSLQGRNKKGELDKREEDAETMFIARPPERRWRDYVIIMWQEHKTEQSRLLKTLGINAGQWVGRNTAPPDFYLDNDMRWYAENIATDFYSAYHRWFPDRPVNWMFRERWQGIPPAVVMGGNATPTYVPSNDPAYLGAAYRPPMVDAGIPNAKLAS